MRIALGLLLAVSMLAAQNANDTPEAHVAIAKTAAGGEVVENRLHADHEMAKLDKGRDLTTGPRNANRHIQLSPRRKPEALRSLVASDPQSKTRSGAGAGMSPATEFSR